MYLSYDLYSKELGGIASEDKFKALEANTESMFDARTRMYYQKHSINEDTNSWRVLMFRKAMTAQINYLFANDVDNADELVNKDIKSVSIDGTTVTNNSSVNDTNSNGISNLALEYLVQTGLLFRGVGLC